MVEDDPLGIVKLALLSDTHHCWVQNPILGCNGVVNVEESEVVVVDMTLGALQSLVRQSCLLLKHMV